MTTLVTGGLGFIGRALVEALSASGHSVRVFDNQARSHTRRAPTFGPEVELRFGDVRDLAFVRRCMEGVDRVFHLAALNGTRNFYERPREVLEVGLLGTHNVVSAALDAEVSELLFMSSSEVYQTPPVLPTPETVSLVVPDVHNPRYSYGGGKIAGELICANYGREGFERLVMVRPHNVYGPDMGDAHVIPELAAKIAAARRMPIPRTVSLQGGGETTRAFVHVEDFVRGCLLALEKGEHLGIYHVGSRDEIRILELAKEIADILDIDVTFTSSPAPAGQTPRRCPDISKIEALGFSPRIGLRSGLEDAVGAWREPQKGNSHEHLSRTA